MTGSNRHPGHLSVHKAGQFFVHLGVRPTEERPGRYAQWCLTREQLASIIGDWTRVRWWWCSVSRPSTEGKYHATAKARKSLPAPLARYLTHNSPLGRVLYHGVGRDDLGAKALRADVYDPHHPDPQVRVLPTGPYNEIHSHYTLNVVSGEVGYAILKHIHDLLSEGGRAIISVRRDLLLPKGDVSGDPEAEFQLD